jgi:hypothetical protein
VHQGLLAGVKSPRPFQDESVASVAARPARPDGEQQVERRFLEGGASQRGANPDYNLATKKPSMEEL